MADARHAPVEALDFASLIALAPEGDGFVARQADVNFNGVVFGGQILAQTIAAAQARAPEDRDVASFNLTFSRPAKPAPLLRFAVETLSAGRSLSVLSVATRQGDASVTTATVTLAVVPSGGPHGRAARSLAAPPAERLDGSLGQLRTLASPATHSAAGLVRNPFVETRLIEPAAFLTTASNDPIRFWIRLRDPLPDDPVLRRPALAYLTDFWLAYAPALPSFGLHDIDRFLVASINHALWFYADTSADEWHLVEVDAPAFASGRGLALARFTHPTRGLAAVVALEAVYRPRRG